MMLLRGGEEEEVGLVVGKERTHAKIIMENLYKEKRKKRRESNLPVFLLSLQSKNEKNS